MFGKALCFAGGVAVGVAIMARLKPASEASCCRRVAAAARAQVNDATAGVGGSILDLLGLSDHLPALIDAAGVPYEP